MYVRILYAPMVDFDAYVYSTYCFVFKAQTRLQTAMDNAKDLVTSGGTVDSIDVASCTKAVQQLENTLSDMTAAGLGEGSPVVTVAKKLACNLNVCAHV